MFNYRPISLKKNLFGDLLYNAITAFELLKLLFVVAMRKHHITCPCRFNSIKS